MSSSGLPATARRSASLPGSRVPVRSAMPQTSAAKAVTLVIASALVMPIDGRKVLDAVGKRGVGLVRADAGVAAADEAGALRGRASSWLAMIAVEPLADRRVDAGRSPGTTAAVIEITQPAGGEVLEHGRVGVDTVGAEEGAVLDRVRAHGERVGDRLGAVGVHGQRQPRGVRLFEGDGSSARAELRLVRARRSGSCSRRWPSP